jgi:Tol biopolymer transport system component
VGCHASGPGANLDAWLAFDANVSAGSHIFVIRPNGCDMQQITSGNADETDPAFSPDGKTLAYTSDATGLNQIAIVDLATGITKTVTNEPAGAAQAAWSPDGKLLAYASNGAIFTVQPDGTGARKVGEDPLGPGAGASYRSPVFSHDGTTVIFDRANEIDALSLDGSVKRSIVQNWTTTEEAPALSPDGLKVAYGAFCDAFESIYFVPESGTTRPCDGERITPASFGTARFPAWGPSGLVAFERDMPSQIAVVDRSSGTMWQPVDQIPTQHNPTWAPAGFQPQH